MANSTNTASAKELNIGLVPVVMTICPRDPNIHDQTFRSLFEAGFTDIHVTAEPGTNTPDYQVHWNQQTEQQGQWRNFIQALRIGLRTRSPYFITCEDDVEFCRQSGAFLARSTWPSVDCGCLQLYSSEKYAKWRPGRGIRSRLPEIAVRDMLGCCALLFRRDAAEELVEWADQYGWRGAHSYVIEEPSLKKAGDRYVGEVLTVFGYSVWIHNPSIVNHIGLISTLDHPYPNLPNRLALNYPGIDADLNAIFGVMQ